MLHALFLALLLAPAPAQSDVDLRAAYDVQAYELDLEVLPDEKRLSGTAVVEATVLSDLLTDLQLDLVDELEVTSVTQGDTALEHVHAENRLTAHLARPAAKGETVRVTVAYSGSPRNQDNFSGFHWATTASGSPWINTSCQGPGAHSWWPCKASYFHPEDKPERVVMRVTVPGDLYAVSNGRLEGIDTLDGNRRAFRWVHEYPLETYAVTLNVAPYEVVEQPIEVPGLGPVPFLYYVLPENAEKAAVQFAEVPELIRIYSEAFGPFPFPKSKIALVETNFWGMEHSTAVAYGSSYPAWIALNGGEDPYARRNRRFDYILVHEMAHEWWGNAVSAADWGDFWIHEGFGTYAEGVYVEQTQGRAQADDYFRGQARSIGKDSRLYRGRGVTSGDAYDSVIYSKGACVLNTLRHYLADDEQWWRALREFNLRFRYRNATTEDFRAVLEEVTGVGWKRFFEQWVYGAGQPALRGRVAVGDGELLVSVENGSTAETGFDVPLDLTWTEAGTARRLRLWIAPGRFEHRVPCNARPEAVQVVHLDRVLGDHEVETR